MSDTSQSPGRYELSWDGSNAAGARVASGVYFYRLFARGTHVFSAERKMIVLR